MIKTNERGGINGLLFPLILTVLLLGGAVAFGVWAYQGRQDYKNNVDAKIVAANQQAVQAEDVKKDAQFAEESKQPLKAYDGPDAYGSLHIMFPKTWSAYVDETGASGSPVSGYFNPGFVPSTNAQTSSFALRFQVLDQSYSDTMQTMSEIVSSNQATAVAYSLPKLPKVVGMRLEGMVQPNKQGTMIVMPLRDKTVEVWTESPQFAADFNNTILPNLTFSP